MGAWVGAALTGANFLSGLFGRKQKSTTTFDNSSTPVYDAKSQWLKDAIINRYSDMMDNAPEFENAYRIGGLNNLRRAGTNATRAVGDILTTMGLGRTMAGASALTDTSYRTAGGIADFLNQIPIIMDERRRNVLNQAGGFLASLPVGQHQTGRSETEGNVPGYGGLAGGVMQGTQAAGTILGQIAAQNNFAKILKQMGGPKYPSYPGATPPMFDDSGEIG